MLLKDYTFCFHGTVKMDGEYIKEQGIDLSKCRYSTDFGQGFYKKAENTRDFSHEMNRLRMRSTTIR